MVAVVDVREVTLNNIIYKVTEDDDRIYYTEVSDRKNKAHFTLSKNKQDNEKAEYGLRVFWTEVFS